MLAASTHLSSAAEAGSTAGATSYEAFRQRFWRSRLEGDAVGYAARRALFETYRAKVEAHNALPNKSWVAAVNAFADLTVAERRAMMGYRRVGGRWSEQAQAASSASFLQMQPKIASVAETTDWRPQLNVSDTFVRDQGNCGSCWAVAAVGALEAHAELAGGPTRRLSLQQLVDCVPNPEHCGGDGGCMGATAELAFAYVRDHGLADDGAYQASRGRCMAKESTTIQSFVRLPENKLQPLLNAVATHGPVVVSVDASDWLSYDTGVFNSCPRDAIVNHAVLLMGYGVDPQFGKYWLIRNSWGKDWGEGAFIRLQRHSSDLGAAGHCGVDRKPQEGVGCQGGPSEVPVCGMCGVLSDSLYPVQVSVSPAGSV